MRRHLWFATLAGLMGVSLLATDARACHRKKRCEAPQPCVTYVAPAPCPVPEPCPPPKAKCGHKFKLFGHRKRCHAPAACAPMVVAAPAMVPAAPVYYPAPQSMPTGQGY